MRIFYTKLLFERELDEEKTKSLHYYSSNILIRLDYVKPGHPQMYGVHLL